MSKTYINFIEELNKNSEIFIKLTEGGINKLEKYKQLLNKWSKTINLVSKKNLHEIDIQIADSLVISQFLQKDKIIDLGTGNGFPAIPLAILNGDCSFSLIEPRKKRVAFLNFVKTTLELKNIKILSKRIEEININESYSGLTAKAFASPEKIQKVSFKFLQKNGKIYLQLNYNQEFEINYNKYILIKEFNYKIEDKNRKLVILGRK